MTAALWLLGYRPGGFGLPGSEKDVDEGATTAAYGFEKLGVSTVSIPWHRDGSTLFSGLSEGTIATMQTGGGLGTNCIGYYATGMLEA